MLFTFHTSRKNRPSLCRDRQPQGRLTHYASLYESSSRGIYILLISPIGRVGGEGRNLEREGKGEGGDVLAGTGAHGPSSVATAQSRPVSEFNCIVYS